MKRLALLVVTLVAGGILLSSCAMHTSCGMTKAKAKKIHKTWVEHR